MSKALVKSKLTVPHFLLFLKELYTSVVTQAIAWSELLPNLYTNWFLKKQII